MQLNAAIMSFDPTIYTVSFFANSAEKTHLLSTQQAEAIQHDTLMRKVDDVEVYVAGGKVQAVYDWHGGGEWILSDDFTEKYVYEVQVAEIEREINSGLGYLCREVTAFKLACGLIVEHDKHDSSPYVLHGRQGGEIDRWADTRELAETVVDTLAEEAEQR